MKKDDTKKQQPFIMIDNRWFNYEDMGLFNYGWLKLYGDLGLFLYSTIKTKLTVNNQYIFNLKEIFSVLKLSPKNDSKRIKVIRKLFQRMQNDSIIQCFNFSGENINFNTISSGDLIYYIQNIPEHFTKIYPEEITKIFTLTNKSINKLKLYSMFVFIMKSINSKTKIWTMGNIYIMENTNIKSEKTIIKYKQIMTDLELIAIDNVGLKLNNYLTDKFYCKQYADTYSRFIDKKKLIALIEVYRKNQNGRVLQYGKCELGNQSRSLKTKLRWQNKLFESGKITEKEYQKNTDKLDEQIKDLKAQREKLKNFDPENEGEAAVI